MPTTLPIRDLKDTAAFAQSVEDSPTPITVTRNGVGAFVAMRCEDYEALQVELAKARLYERMELAEREYASGAYTDGESFLSAMRKKYGA